MTHAIGMSHLDLEALPEGSRRSFNLEVVALGDGTKLALPVNVLQGARGGPCLAAVAGIHGDEADGIMALLELWEELAPETLAGRLVMVPVANPPAFIAGRRRSPLDDLDLNRIFPGRSEGLPSEQLAYRLFTEVLLAADFVISLHGWYATGTVLPYVEFNHTAGTAAASYRAAAAAGFDLIRISNWSPGLMTRVANEAGIPGIETEIGGMGTSRAENRRRYKGHLMGLMQHLGMLAGEPPLNPAPRLVEHFDVFAPVGGLLRLSVDLGTMVEKGGRLATLHDLHGAPVHEVLAPDSGVVGACWTFVSAQPGTLLFRMFRDTDRAIVERFRATPWRE